MFTQFNSLKKIRVGVLMGGRSLEDEVSFNSGRTICDHLSPLLYEVIPIFQNSEGALFILPWYFLHRGKISDFYSRLEAEALKVSFDEIKKYIDIIYLALHGSYAEDGLIYGLLFMYSIPYVGASIFSCALSHNKYMHNIFLKANKINAIDSFLVYPHDDIEKKIKEILIEYSFPLIIKPNEEGSSLGVSLVKNEKELYDGILYAQKINPQRKQLVLVQKKIDGKEFSCILIQKNEQWEAFQPTEIIHKREDYVFDYVDKYMPGASIKKTPSSFSEEIILNIQLIGKKIAETIEASSIIRVDGFVQKDNSVVILETNMFPGMSPSSFTFIQAAYSGYSHATLINQLIEEGLKKNNISIPEKGEEIKKREDSKLKIAILFGGDSNEREISLESGRNVYCKLSVIGYELDSLFMRDDKKIYKIPYFLLVKNSTLEIEESLLSEMEISWEKIKKEYGFVFLALHGGSGEDGTVQAMLESLNIPYNGSGVLTSSLCMNKYKTNAFLSSFGVDVPRSIYLDIFTLWEEEFLKFELKKKDLSFPLIVKPHDDGCSTGVIFCRDLTELKDAKKELELLSKKFCLVEEYIDAMELTVGVFGNYEEITVLPLTYTPKKKTILSLTEKFLPGDATNITPAPLSIEETVFIQEKIKKIYQLLGCLGYARIDFFYKKIDNKKKIIFLECNTLPALTPATCLFHQASEVGITPVSFLEKIVKLGLKKNENNN